MTTAIRTGLTRITVSAPRRRIDLVLPDHVPVAELLPTILDYAGEGAPDDAEKHGGFDLRRADGKTVNPTQSMAMQQIRDGEVLHLAPRHADWPEGEYDDVVEAIAAGAKVLGKPWEGNHTRVTGLTIALVAGAASLIGLWQAGPPASSSWLLPGIVGISIGVVLLAIGIALARASGDSVAGATLGGLSLPFAAFGGYIVLGGRYEMELFDASHLLMASATLLLFSIVGFYAVGESLRVFTAGVVVGFFGLVAAALGLLFAGTTAVTPAAATVSIVMALLPSIPLLSMRFAKLPMPELPQSAKELIKDTPNPPKEEIFAKVVRADELLTGLLIGVSIVAVFALYFVDSTGIPAAAPLLVLFVSAAFLLRARLFPAVRQRIPLLTTGIIGLLFLADDAIGLFGADLELIGLLVVILPAIAIATASALIYSKRAPSPYIGRIADAVDILFLVAIIPTACTAMGLFALFSEFF